MHPQQSDFPPSKTGLVSFRAQRLVDVTLFTLGYELVLRRIADLYIVNVDTTIITRDRRSDVSHIACKYEFRRIFDLTAELSFKFEKRYIRIQKVFLVDLTSLACIFEGCPLQFYCATKPRFGGK